MRNWPPNKVATQRNLPWVLLTLVVLTGAFLRFFQIGSESYWLDEMATVYTGQTSVSSLLAHWNFDTPPLFFTLFHIWETLFGLSEAATRSFSAIAGVISIVLLYFIGKRLFNWKVGILSALLLAVSESEIFYSQETRFYGWLGLFSLLSVWIFLKAIQNGKKLDYLLLGLINALLFFTHAFGCFIILAEAVYFLLYWKKYKTDHLIWFIGQCITGFCMLVALCLTPSWRDGIFNAAHTIVKWIPRPTLTSPLKTLYYFIFPLREGRPWWMIAVSLGLGVLIVVVGGFIYGMMKRQYQNGDLRTKLGSVFQIRDSQTELVFLFCWLLIPMVIPFVLSFVVSPIYLDRYVSEAAPALMLILGYAIYKLGEIVPEWVIVLGLLVFIIPGLVNYYSRDIHEEWKEVARDIQQQFLPGDVVIFAPDQDGYETRLFDWYATQSVEKCSIDANLIDEESIGKTLAACAQGHQRFWLVMRGPTDLMNQLINTYLPENAPADKEIEQKSYTGIQVNLYQIQPVN